MSEFALVFAGPVCERLDRGYTVFAFAELLPQSEPAEHGCRRRGRPRPRAVGAVSAGRRARAARLWHAVATMGATPSAGFVRMDRRQAAMACANPRDRFHSKVRRLKSLAMLPACGAGLANDHAAAAEVSGNSAVSFVDKRRKIQI